MKKHILLFLILAGAFLVRLYHFDWPVADWQSWRQADTSAVSRYFTKNGFDLLRPHFEDLSIAVSLKDNPQGYRFVEFPLYNAAQAGLFKLFDQYTLEEWGRLVTIFSSLASIIFIYLLVAKYANSRTGLIAAGFFAFIPFSIYYGRSILPDQSMVAAILGGTYFFDRWIEESSRLQSKIKNYFLFLISVVFTAVALLLKPYAIFFMLPMAYLAWNRLGFNLLKKWQLYLFLILSIAPLVLWRSWMNQPDFLSGIARNDWLLNGNHIRFKGAFFQWLFADRIGRLILGYWGLPFVVLGIIRKINKKENWFFYFFIIASVAYMTVFATGNVQHDYYQILIVPTLAIFFAKGVDLILEKKEIFNRFVTYLTLVAAFVFMFAFSWFVIRDYYSIQHPHIIDAGMAADKLLPKDAKVVAPYGGDTTLLYYTKRAGWPVFDRSFKDYKKAGASYMVFADPTPDELGLENLFKVVTRTADYIIFDMTQPTSEGIAAQQKD
ncbi:MAG: glycosyltransferase family 39 protein [Candidatus Levybacteria bacterium]|nr:glycosyltransferase family 39 protein [Candidatus Levybacteria bacterium]